jgi:hypothetical protein
VSNVYTQGDTIMCFFSFKSYITSGDTLSADRKQELNVGTTMYYSTGDLHFRDIVEHKGLYYRLKYTPVKLKKIYKVDLIEIFDITVQEGVS